MRVGRSSEHLKAGLTVSLEAVRRTAGLERAASQHFRARSLDGGRGQHALLLGLRRTGAGHDDHLIAANPQVVDRDDGVLGPIAAARPLVGLGDAHHLVDAFENADHFLVHFAGADHAEHRPGCSRRPVHVHPQLHQPGDNHVDLRLGGPLFHYNDHDVFSASCSPRFLYPVIRRARVLLRRHERWRPVRPAAPRR